MYAWFVSYLELWARSLRYRYKIDRVELKILRRLVRKGDVCVDVGAHKGAYTFLFRTWVGDLGQVVSFEPQDVLFQRLSRGVQKIGWKNVTIEPLCISNSEGELDFFQVPGRASTGATLNPNVFSENSQAVKRKVSTLDCYFKNYKKIDHLKIDVESLELEVIEGGLNVIQKDCPSIFFEGEARISGKEKILRLFDLLKSWGYQGFFFYDGKVIELSKFQFEIHQNQETPGYPNSIHYSNNFLFLKRALESK